MKQFTQLLALILLSAHFHISASNIHRNDTIGKFNEITDIEVQLRNLQDTTRTSKTNSVPLVRLKEAISTKSQDTTKTSFDTHNNSSKDSIIVHPNTIEVNPSNSIKPDSIAGPQTKRHVFTPIVVKTSLDSFYSRRSNGTIQLPKPIERSSEAFATRLNFRDTMFYNPLFLPIVFTGRVEAPDSAFVYPVKKHELKDILIPSDKTFQPLLEKQAFIDKVRRDYYLENPTKVKFSESDLSGARQAATDIEVREKFNPFKELLSSQTSFSLETPDVEGIKIGRVYWVRSGEHSLQFSQNYYSPNWQQGGTSNLNINNYHVFRANYTKNKVRFNNMLEWRLTLYNAPDDTIRSYRVGDDLLRYYGDFGLDAYKKTWSYSTNLEARTQMFTSHVPNKDELRSAFLAPLFVNAGIGMKYNYDKASETVRHRRVRLSIDISPLSISYKYVGNNEIDVRRFGIPEGEKSIFDKGSTVTSLLTYDITRYVTWTSRLKYFTNYSKIEAEYENTLNMSLSRFFSTRMYLNLRYNDGVPKDADFGYLQVNEVVSFGLNYKW